MLVPHRVHHLRFDSFAVIDASEELLDRFLVVLALLLLAFVEGGVLLLQRDPVGGEHSFGGNSFATRSA